MSQVVHFPINAVMVVLVLVLLSMMMMKMRRRRRTARGDGDKSAGAGDNDDEDDKDEGKLTWRQLATNSSLVSTPSWLVSNLAKEVCFSS